jgi:hypothetical protein
MNSLRSVLLTLALLMCARVATAADDAYLFTYFVDNGQDGLHLAWSEDGYHWQSLGGGKSFLQPLVGNARLMRDPCVTRGPDGVYHMVWTSGWAENNIGSASTRDFINWSAQQEIPVMAHEPAVRNTWAPEVVWDAQRREFLIFWASTVPGRFAATAGSSENELNHRIYSTTTRDWRRFTPTQLFYDPGFSVIDATLLHVEDGWRLIVKDETSKPPKKHLRMARGDSPAGPWHDLSPPFTRDWVEGPTAIKVGDDYLVYFDVYKEQHYGAVRSRDLLTWEDVTDKISLPAGVRHGTIIKVPRALIARLQMQ